MHCIRDFCVFIQFFDIHRKAHCFLSPLFSYAEFGKDLCDDLLAEFSSVELSERSERFLNSDTAEIERDIFSEVLECFFQCLFGIFEGGILSCSRDDGIGLDVDLSVDKEAVDDLGGLKLLQGLVGLDGLTV